MGYLFGKKFFIITIVLSLIFLMLFSFIFFSSIFKDGVFVFSNGGLFGVVCLFFGFMFAGVFIIPTTPLFLLAVGLMSPVYAFFFIVVSVAIASIAPFLLARRFGEKKFHELLHKKYPLIDSCDHVLSKYGFWFVLALHVFPIVPLSITNYICGLSKVKFSHFMFGTISGTIPVALLYCAVSFSVLKDAHIAMIISLVIGIIVFIVLGVYFFRRWVLKFGSHGESSFTGVHCVKRVIVK